MNTIVDDIRSIVEAMQAELEPVPAPDPDEPGAGAPYFMAGHRMEISNRLTEKNVDKVFKYQKYPLVALRMDIDEHTIGEVIYYTLNIAFLDFNDRKENAEERLESVFKPTLIPLYELFMKHLRFSGIFMWPGNQGDPDHRKIMRPFWGTEETNGNKKHIFNDPLDCLEIINLKINKHINNC